MQSADMIRARVVAGAFDTAAEEMSATVTRTARSPIFNEAHDFTTGIFELHEGKTRLIAQAPGCTLHLYAICSAVQAALDVFKNDLHPGDIILASDPGHGGTHIPDHVVILPVFADRKPVFFPVVRAHFADSGGPVAGGYNPASRDIWQDGVVVPPLKLYEKGERRGDVFDLILANNRAESWLKGDLDAMRGACLTAARGIERVVERFGLADVRQAIDHNIAYTERRVRAEIAAWPDGDYFAETFIDHDYQGAHDIRVACTARVRGSDITFDFTGSAPQVDGFVNSTLANTLSFVFVAIASCVDEDVPINEGYINPVKVVAPEGTVINPRWPKPVGNCTCICGAEIAEVALLALSQCAPERVGVNCHKLPLAYTSGHYADGKPWISLNFHGYTGGAGAAYGTDGWGLYPPLMTGVILPSIEMNEMQYPMRIERHEYVRDTEGAGLWRGAPGVGTRIRFLAENITNAMLAGVRHPTRGFCGGHDGPPNALALTSEGIRTAVTEVVYNHRLASDSTIEFLRGGGGGWGQPFGRPETSVLADVLNDYVSPEAAHSVYGVAINLETMTVDEDTTARLRSPVPAAAQ
ncbi:hydantoinase B/oxoprolinase family protein [Mesorhizobium sp. LHD-90]|uniref:hydantoinase B/oxoprolinase family protein n=1 Tax=Mesorhizobium sp. LHD-90 TaxID=3071414 RepID=UPI0027DF1B88|nr:hydantoinase B/oxoprolinase family protein [Mesorhizobium sp. LHD-90]MDQ6435608.1 hydantoinase B/oxoprolinase family protein [Mesorhizobium sp. LHD-90]